MALGTYPVSAGDVVTPTGFRGAVDYASQNPSYVLEVVAATLTLTHGQAVGDRAGGAFAAVKIPALFSSGAKMAHSGAKVATSLVTCDWDGAASAGHTLSVDVAMTGYNAHCATSFARSMGVTSVPSMGTFGIACLGYAVANAAYSNLQTVFCQNVNDYQGTAERRDLYERNVCKNWYELGDNLTTLVYCVLFLLGVTLSSGWIFMIAVAGLLFNFGAYLERSEMQNNSMNQLLGRANG